MQNARMDESQTGIKIAGRNINNLRYAYDTTLMAESKEELQRLLMKVKEESEKKLRTWHLIPSLHGKQMEKKMETVTSLFLGAPKSLQTMTTAMKLKDAYSLEEKL